MRRDERGAALVEFAIVFGLFVFILYGLVAFGMMLALKQSMTNASAEAARSAIGISDDATAISRATTTAQQRLNWLSGADWSQGQKGAVTITPSIATCSGGSGRCLTVNVSYNYSGHPLVPPAPGLGLVTPNSFFSSSTVQIT